MPLKSEERTWGWINPVVGAASACSRSREEEQSSASGFFYSFLSKRGSLVSLLEKVIV